MALTPASQQTKPVLGFVGLGLVGSALAQRAIDAGFICFGYDIDPAARQRFATMGGQALDSNQALGFSANTIILAVLDTPVVIRVIREILEGGRPDAIIDCSTGDPQAVDTLARELAEQSIGLIEAPLSGSSAQILAGEATMLLGAPTELLTRHDALLAVLSPRRVHVGGSGMGARAKLASNLVLGLNRAALAEGIVFAQGLGIAPERFLEIVLNTPARSDAALAKGNKMVSEDFSPQSRITQHLKDLDLILGNAAKQGQPLPLTQTHAQLLRDAVAAGDGALDNAAIINQLRRLRS